MALLSPNTFIIDNVSINLSYNPVLNSRFGNEFIRLNSTLIINKIKRLKKFVKENYKCMYKINYHLNILTHDIHYTSILFYYKNSREVLLSCINKLKLTKDYKTVHKLLHIMHQELDEEYFKEYKRSMLLKYCLKKGIYIGSMINNLPKDIRENIANFI